VGHSGGGHGGNCSCGYGRYHALLLTSPDRDFTVARKDIIEAISCQKPSELCTDERATRERYGRTEDG
jgi:hypothetical protein